MLRPRRWTFEKRELRSLFLLRFQAWLGHPLLTPMKMATVGRTPATTGTTTALVWTSSQPKIHPLRLTLAKPIATARRPSSRPAPSAPAKPTDLPLSVLVPAYVLSELRIGFQIGAVLFLPFLVIDLIVASVTLSVGMVQLPPVMLSAPFKILLFVLVDGWNLVVGSLIRSFGT